jgi:signal recognition particle receptor subunit alpha
MLDSFEILTTSGVVLWSRSYAPVGAHIINSLVNDVFIEEKALTQKHGADTISTAYKKEKYTMKWRRAKDMGLIFVVCLGDNISAADRTTGWSATDG